MSSRSVGGLPGPARGSHPGASVDIRWVSHRARPPRHRYPGGLRPAEGAAPGRWACRPAEGLPGAMGGVPQQKGCPRQRSCCLQGCCPQDCRPQGQGPASTRRHPPARCRRQGNRRPARRLLPPCRRSAPLSPVPGMNESKYVAHSPAAERELVVLARPGPLAHPARRWTAPPDPPPPDRTGSARHPASGRCFLIVPVASPSPK